MVGDSEERSVLHLIEGVQKLTVTIEQVVSSFSELLRKQEEDRAENKERQKKFDEDQEEFRKRQKKWDDLDWCIHNPWVQPRELAYLFHAVALAATAITIGILATR